jgi:crotonobetainyl-CoA:carnitine CoA-transferase CaiB-like acyl-CoA transferase
MDAMLRPYRVLDLTTERGLLCGQLLGDLGADVIKVETPGGDAARRLGPFYQDVPHPDRSLFWWAYNRNKRSITLDLNCPEGQTLLRQLATQSDFLIESDTPGALAARGLGYEELATINPALVYVSITPFGQTGPKARYADSDLIILAASGPLVLTGDDDRPPLRVSVPQGYLHASAEAAVAALIAHHECQRSGLGQHVDVSAQQAAMQATQSFCLAAPLNDSEVERMSGGAKVGNLVVQLVWPAQDGDVAILFLFGPAIGPFTRRLMEWIHEDGGCDAATCGKDWIGFLTHLLTGQEPLSEYDRLKRLVGEFTMTKSKAELSREALARGLLIAPVTTIGEVVNSEHLAERDYWRLFDHPEWGRSFRYPGPFAKFGQTPIAYRSRPPTVGEHNDAVYRDELGLSAEEIVILQRRGVI